MVNNFKKWISDHIAFFIVIGVAILCIVFLLYGTKSESGSITLDGNNAKIEEYTENFIEDANKRLDEIMNHEAPTDAETIELNDTEEVGLGFNTSIGD